MYFGVESAEVHTKDIENLFTEIMAENFSNLRKAMWT
jgi:hypothetical protein